MSATQKRMQLQTPQHYTLGAAAEAVADHPSPAGQLGVVLGVLRRRARLIAAVVLAGTALALAAGFARPDPLHGEGAGRDRAAPAHGPEHQQRAGGAARRGSGTRGDAGPQLLRAGEARGRGHGPGVRPRVPAATALGDSQAAGRRRRPAGVAPAGTAPRRRPRPCPGDGRQPGRGRRDPPVPVPHGGRPGGGVTGDRGQLHLGQCHESSADREPDRRAVPAPRG